MNENKFDKMGEIYAQFRPSYPEAFIDYLYDEVGFTEQSIIADIGSGTGKLTRQLLTKGNKVFSVEPNDDMREIAENELYVFENFVSVDGTAENTSLQAGSIDFITVAQAFHWFDRQKFKSECERILTQEGKLVLVWNSRNEKSESTVECDKIHRKYCPNFKGFSGGMRGTDENVFVDFFIKGHDARAFENNLVYDEQAFIGRQLSSSYALKETDKYYKQYVTELKDLFYKYNKNGKMVISNLTRSYVGGF